MNRWVRRLMRVVRWMRRMTQPSYRRADASGWCTEAASRERASSAAVHRTNCSA
ncbi:hypothetical protein ACFFRL_01940 [Agromyces hippuratus]|uniref:hypothetical protein n=1 Tax=Agromyces hippuratus TaxID=286438 RepID=UPI0035E6A607